MRCIIIWLYADMLMSCHVMCSLHVTVSVVVGCHCVGAAVTRATDAGDERHAGCAACVSQGIQTHHT